MERRSFFASSIGLFAIGNSWNLRKPLPRRAYKPGIDLSIIGFGGIVLVGMDQQLADYTVSWAWDQGVNYFDVAPSYWDGEAESKLGEALKPFRKNAFLACKTNRRDAQGAREELEQSLSRLQTDYFDLYQFHAVTSLKDVEKILGPGGAAETFVKAREEGKIRHIGFSAHSEEAALALMDQFTFDSILFPFNYVCYSAGNFGPRVMEVAKKKGVSRLALKAMAHGPWPKEISHEERMYKKCWYEPLDNTEKAAMALRFTLSQDISAAIPPGEDKLFRMAVNFAAGFEAMSLEEQKLFLDTARNSTPLFSS